MPNLPSTIWERLDTLISGVQTLQELKLPGTKSLLTDLEFEVVTLTEALREHDEDGQMYAFGPKMKPVVDEDDPKPFDGSLIIIGNALARIATDLETAREHYSRYVSFAPYGPYAEAELAEKNRRQARTIEELMGEIRSLKDAADDRDDKLQDVAFLTARTNKAERENAGLNEAVNHLRSRVKELEEQVGLSMTRANILRKNNEHMREKLRRRPNEI